MYSALIKRGREFERLVLLLDYDGTLVPFAPTPDQAAPDSALLELLSALTHRPHTDVHIVSGRDRETLTRWFGGISLGLHAEHGLWSRLRPEEKWQAVADISTAWKDELLPIFKEFAQNTPGSLVEIKSASLAWHYRRVDPKIGISRAIALQRSLTEVVKNHPVDLLMGDKVIEVKLRGVHKGRIIEKFFWDLRGTMLVALGDDSTDEDLFAALPEGSIAVHVGPNPSRAPFRLRDYRAARAFLWSLIDDATNGPEP